MIIRYSTPSHSRMREVPWLLRWPVRRWMHWRRRREKLLLERFLKANYFDG